MPADDPAARYLALKEKGATPEDIYSAARMHDLSRAEAIGILCSLYGFPQAQAERVVVSIEGPPPVELPAIGSYDQLVEILKQELGYCDCAPDDAVRVLRNVLRAAQDRTEATGDSEAFGRASRALEACLPLDAAPGLASWFVYGLQQRNLIWHGFRLTDAWITDKGRWLLEAIDRLPPPRRE